MIIKEELQENLYEISSDFYEGRETGKDGQKRAAEFLATYYRNQGFAFPEAAPDYFQKYPLEIHQPTKITLCVGDSTFDFFDEFYSFGDLKDTVFNWAEAIFVGHGIEEDNYSDYQGLDVKNKMVVILEGQPKDVELKEDWDNWRLKYALAKEKEASVLFIVKEKFYENAEALSSLYTSNRQKLPPMYKRPSMFTIPSIYISEELKALLLGNKNPEKGDVKEISVELIANTKVESIEVENIIAIIEGTDLYEEVLVVSSHYDHIGFDDMGNICNGADDDGSGTVATMQIAKAFKEAEKAGVRPLRTIVFIHFSGEEKGLLGSTYYSYKPIYPMKKTITNLNIDMVGRSDDSARNPNYVYLIGSDKISSDLDSVCQQVKRAYDINLELDYKYNDSTDRNRFYYRSDHYNFARYGVPVVFFFTGVHEDYHKHTDTAEKIDYEKLETISRYIFKVAWKLSYTPIELRKDNMIQTN